MNFKTTIAALSVLAVVYYERQADIGGKPFGPLALDKSIKMAYGKSEGCSRLKKRGVEISVAKILITYK